MVVPIRVGADDGRMAGEVFFAEFQAKGLCLFHGQPVISCISGVEADDILVALDIIVLGVLAILAVCQQAGRCEREIATLKGVEQIRIPQLRLALFIQKLLSGERVVLVNEVRFAPSGANHEQGLGQALPQQDHFGNADALKK